MDCLSDDQVLAEADGQAFTCAHATATWRYVSAVAGRPLPARDRGRVNAELRDRFRADPGTGLALAQRSVDELARLEALPWPGQAEERGRLGWQAVSGKGLITESLPATFGVQKRGIAPWVTDDEAQLVLAEADVEGWIHYTSLCREVQEGGPLALSVADRLPAYRSIRTRFEAADRGGKVALLSVGPYWASIKDHWASASYERQQAWMAAAPLPPPMVATSLGYVEALLAGEPERHMRAFHDQLGPFRLQVPR